METNLRKRTMKIKNRGSPKVKQKYRLIMFIVYRIDINTKMINNNKKNGKYKLENGDMWDQERILKLFGGKV